jgi:3-mercaptopyruvate sulfurtransferase SseA
MRLTSRLAPALLALLVAILSHGAQHAASAQQPTFELIKVAQLDFLLKKSAKVQIIDVRSRQEYLTRHIKGAISIPLDTIELRAAEVPRQGLVVLY